MTIKKQTAQHQALDPCLLGRPVHRLHLFAGQLADDLTQTMRLNVNRRYWGTFQIEEVKFDRLNGAEARTRWLDFPAPAGAIGFSLERKVLLSVLEHRYGRGKGEPAAGADDASVRVTATEERLAVALGQQLTGTLAARIELNLPADEKPLAADQDGRPAPASQPPKGTWIIAVTVSDTATGQTGRFWFALDKALMAGVLRGLLAEREQARKAAPRAAPLTACLSLTLTAQLISKEMLLASLFDLRVGDIIPISLHRADVLLDDSRLFTAAVGERKGKLCITSFEDVE